MQHNGYPQFGNIYVVSEKNGDLLFKEGYLLTVALRINATLQSDRLNVEKRIQSSVSEIKAVRSEAHETSIIGRLYQISKSKSNKAASLQKIPLTGMRLRDTFYSCYVAQQRRLISFILQPQEAKTVLHI